MIGLNGNIRIFAYPEAADLRKGYDGLYALVLMGLGRDPLSGDCFLFTNRNRNLAKVLFYDGTGLCIYMKRLERGRFADLQKRASENSNNEISLTASELALFLEGNLLLAKISLSPKKISPMLLTNALQ